MGGSTIKFNVTFCIEALFAVPYQTVSVRREHAGGRKHIKVGNALINLAEYAGRSKVERRYLLQSARKASRQDNSVLKVVVSTDLIQGSPVFKAASVEQVLVPAMSFANSAIERLESDSISYTSSSTAHPLSEGLENPDEIVSAILADAAISDDFNATGPRLKASSQPRSSHTL
eukprot:gene5380-7130_t